MLASEIASRARLILNDSDKVRWFDSELLDWINDAQRVIAMVRPDSSVSNATVELVGGTRQALPENGQRLLDVVRNITEGGGAGRAVRLVDRDALDTQNPDWHADTASLTVKNFVYDNRDPFTFYVYPPAIAGAQLEIIYSHTPAELDSLGDAITVSDIYADAVLNFVLFRAFSKDTEYAQTPSIAGNYLAIFSETIGLKSRLDLAYSPDLNSKGGSPSPGVAVGGV
jgi:hypothetical protein